MLSKSGLFSKTAIQAAIRPGLILIAAFVCLLVAYSHVSPQITGDEPHYLLVDRSIAHYHTLNLKPAYANQDYLGYYPAPGLLPQGDQKFVSMNNPTVYSMHGIGLPLFTMPGYVLAAKTGVIVQMVLLAVAVLALTWLWCKRVTGNTTAAYLATGSLLLCFFFNGLSGYIYPDMLIAAIILACLLLLTSKRYASPLSQLGLGLALGVAMLAHYRNVMIAAPALAVLSFQMWRQQHRLPWIAAITTAIFGGLFMLSQYLWFGTLDPTAPYGNLTSISHQPFGNIAAMLFDSSRGLLIYNPILLLLAIGLPIWYKLDRPSLIKMLIVAGPTMVVLAFFDQWTGGAAPVGRYIIAFLPTLIPALAFAFQRLTSWWQRGIAGLLAALSLAISLDAILNRFTFISYDSHKGTSMLVTQLRDTFGLNIERVLPSFTNDTQLIGKLGLVKLAACFIVLFVLVWYGYRLVKDSVHDGHSELLQPRNTKQRQQKHRGTA